MITHDSRKITNNLGLSKSHTKWFQMAKGLKKPQPENKHSINRRRTIAQPEKPKTKCNNNMITGK